MNPSRIIILTAATVLASGCALFNKVAPPGVANVANSAKNVGGEGVAIIEEAGRQAKLRCDPIRKSEVAWAEERAMGGVVSIDKVAGSGGLVMDGITATDAKALADQVTESEKNAKKRVTLPDSPKNDLTAYVAVVGKNLAKYSSRPEIPWTFAVVDNETPNALSAPGGYVMVTTGLLKKVTNEAQLAGVLAHEIGHVVHKHSIKRYRDAKATQCDIATVGGYVIGKGVKAAESLLPPATREAAKFSAAFDNYDLDKGDSKFVVFIMDAVLKAIELLGNEKEDEFQADATALELVAFAGYDASEYEKFLTSLGNSGGGFSKHPSTTDRVAKLKALREGEMAPFATGTAKPDIAKPFAVINAKK